DVLGREIATLVDEINDPGIYNSQLSILNSQLSTGIYFYQLKAGNFIETKKMVVVK
ncbi:MAG: T9SS type A sorting domain-containing protein, partial [Ignavibacteria bacterium]|nr:T9SS type A sorting domain-containing protein [Ignavibacteria bacterium]